MFCDNIDNDIEAEDHLRECTSVALHHSFWQICPHPRHGNYYMMIIIQHLFMDMYKVDIYNTLLMYFTT